MSMRSYLSSRTACSAAAFLASSSSMLVPASAPSPSPPGQSPDDLSFGTDAFNLIDFDRQECTIARTQSKNPEVRALAEQFLQQANEFDARLRPIAAEAGVKPPTVLRSNLRVRAARLRLGQGLDFDRSFVEDQIASHQDTLNMQDAIVNTPGSNPKLQELSRQGNEILRTNLASLHELQRKLMTMRG